MKNLFLISLLVFTCSCSDWLDPSKAAKDPTNTDQVGDSEAAAQSLEVQGNGTNWTYISGRANPSVGNTNAVELFLWDENKADPCNFNGTTANSLEGTALKNSTTFLSASQSFSVKTSAGASETIDTGKLTVTSVNTNTIEMVFNATESDSLKAVGSFTVTLCN